MLATKLLAAAVWTIYDGAVRPPAISRSHHHISAASVTPHRIVPPLHPSPVVLYLAQSVTAGIKACFIGLAAAACIHVVCGFGLHSSGGTEFAFAVVTSDVV